MIVTADLMITNKEAREREGKFYYSADASAISDGKPIKVSVISEEVYNTLETWQRLSCKMQLLDSKYGMKLTILSVE